MGPDDSNEGIGPSEEVAKNTVEHETESDSGDPRVMLCIRH